MSYHKFSTSCKKQQSDINNKLMVGIFDQELAGEDCNCNKAMLDKEGTYIFGGLSGRLMVVLGLQCMLCMEQPTYW